MDSKSLPKLELNFIWKTIPLISGTVFWDAIFSNINISQKAWVASGYVNAEVGGDRTSDGHSANLQNGTERTTEDMAKKFGVSERSVRSARAIRRAIETGKLLEMVLADWKYS